jgi:hypothetical protein
MALFDEIVLSKRNRGRTSIFSGRSTTDFLSDTSNHLWRTANATFSAPTSRSQQNLSADYTRVVTRGKSNIQPAPPLPSLTIFCSTGEIRHQPDDRTPHDPRRTKGFQDGEYCPPKALAQNDEWPGDISPELTLIGANPMASVPVVILPSWGLSLVSRVCMCMRLENCFSHLKCISDSVLVSTSQSIACSVRPYLIDSFHRKAWHACVLQVPFLSPFADLR